MGWEQVFAPVVSGLFGLAGADKASEDKAAARAQDMAIFREQQAFQEKQFQNQLAQQKRQEELSYEFAKSGVQWKVADAVKAGLHPLAALGASTASGPSVSVGSVGSVSPPRASGASPMGSALSQMGQDVSRAMMATQSDNTRDMMVNNTMTELSLKNMELRNNLIAAQIAKISNGQVGPGFPSPDQNFPVSENPKTEQRPPLMLHGNRWVTDPGSSPMKAWEDQYGDEGPPSWLVPLMLMYSDMKKNTSHPYGEKNIVGTTWAWIDRLAEEHINQKLAPPPWSNRLQRAAKPLGRR